ncbi:MAG: hypothetical protein ABT20_05910 [Rubrivivax sp. SCN 70-15]|nr:MAG: hypothetical protein ABT20_05910 [Rubrivivax sp. SCN 70-15]
MRGRASDLNIRGAFLHMAADALVSAGVVVAGGLALACRWTWLDPVASLAIAAVIVAGIWRLFRQSLHLRFDGGPESVDLRAVQALLEALRGAGARPACLGDGMLRSPVAEPMVPREPRHEPDADIVRHRTDEVASAGGQ